MYHNSSDDLSFAQLMIIILTVVIGAILFILSFSIPCMVNKQQELELEKYKLEMQYKHGDIVEEN